MSDPKQPSSVRLSQRPRFSEDWSLVEQAEIVARAKKGDPAAQERIYRHYAQRVFNLAYRMVWHRETAQELMQESFIDVLKGLHSFRGDVPLYAWVRKVAVNRCLQFLRKRKEVYTAEPVYLSELYSDQSAATEKQKAEFDVSKLLQRLTPKRRAIVWLYQVEGFTHKEIAESMGKSVSFSKMEYSRALKDLQNIVGREKKSLELVRERNKQKNI